MKTRTQTSVETGKIDNPNTHIHHRPVADFLGPYLPCKQKYEVMKVFSTCK